MPFTQAFKGRQVNVRDLGAVGDGRTDDSAAFSRAFSLAVAVNGPKRIIVPAGTYLVGDLNAVSNILLEGEGKCVLRQSPGSKHLLSLNASYDANAGVMVNCGNVTLRNLEFSGWVNERDFSEHIHLLNINGAENVTVERCNFVGFCGDGVYIGSGNRAGMERHNKHISIRQCIFDGVNGNNRNGVSVIDCDYLLIERCRFDNCSRRDMPGAIDVEPDENRFHRVMNITIRENQISRCTGNLAAISVYIPTHRYDLPPKNIIIDANRIDGGFTTNGISIRVKDDVADAEASLAIQVSRNKVLNTIAPIIVAGAKGVGVTSNVFNTSEQPASIGLARNGRCSDVEVRDNRFFNLGKRGRSGIRVFRSDRVSFARNHFRDWGANSSLPIALDLSATEPGRLAVADNKFESTDGVSRVALALPAAVSAKESEALTSQNAFVAVIPTN